MEDSKGTLIVAETGSDIPAELVSAYNINIVPMHVAMGNETLDDGKFPIQKIYDYYKRTKRVPTTSATNPEEYKNMFEKLHRLFPEKQILHLCYSAVTTATYQNSLIGSEDMDYVTHMDTKGVSLAQAAVVLKIARFLEKKPFSPMEELIAVTQNCISRLKFSFLPGSLEYLRAGGRVSNAAYLGASILGIKPLIEIIDGKLICTKKYRGKIQRVSLQLIEDAICSNNYEKDELYLVYSEGLDKEVMDNAVTAVKKLGYPNVQWIKTGGVITCHSGPGAFGIGGFSAEQS
ncbi:Protein DegV [bioreactor metagenome]|uniref:Protein DegV n=1 Tax=bioreactor metagenome TaxID=1076179 RepID=A0A645AJK6_9ZZZZ|nr:DegV family protein [Candidatus Metalachnospira sp.]